MPFSTPRRLVLLAVLLAPLPAAGASDPPAPAPAAAGAGTWDLGDLDEDAVVTRDFEVKNGRDVPLRILGLHPSCGCLSLRVDAREIPPGGRATISATYTAAGMEGAQRHSLVVTTSDPARPSIRWNVAGRVRDIASATPGRSVFLGRVRRTEPRRREVRVLPGEDAPAGSFEESRVLSHDPDLAVEAQPLESGGRRGLRLSVGPGPDHPAGPFAHDVLVLVRAGKKELRIRISVSGILEGPVVAVPPRLDLGAFRRNEFPSPIVLVGSPGREPFRVLAAAAAGPLEAETAPADIPGAFVVRLRLKPEAAPGTFGSEVRISTDHPKAPAFSVPVTGTLLPDWTIEPAEALLRLSARGEAASISVVFAGPDPPRAVRPDIPATLPVLAEAVPREGDSLPASAWRVRIRLAESAKAPAEGVLLLKADAKSPVSVPLPVRILP